MEASDLSYIEFKVMISSMLDSMKKSIVTMKSISQK